jgi:hypothetical protein
MNMTTSLDCMKMTTFVGLALFFSLGIWGRSLREKAFRALSVEQKVQVADKMANYTSGEMIPFVGLMLGLLAIMLFRPGWLRAAFAIFVALLLVLVSAFHLRARDRFRTLGLPAAFLSQYEHSRIVAYSSLGVLLAIWAWVLYRLT